MTHSEKQRMIHVRLDRKVHKELRKVAAEYDVSIQEIVSGAVEKQVEALETEISIQREGDSYKLEITESIDVGTGSELSEESVSKDVSIAGRLTGIESAITMIAEQISTIRKMLASHE